MTKAFDFDIAKVRQLVKEVGKMRFEYLQVYLSHDKDRTIRYLAFDSNSVCDSDKRLINLLNRLGQDRWEYCTYIKSDGLTTYDYHLLKRSLP